MPTDEVEKEVVRSRLRLYRDIRRRSADTPHSSLGVSPARADAKSHDSF